MTFRVIFATIYGMSELEMTAEIPQDLASIEPQEPIKKGYFEHYRSLGEILARIAGTSAPGLIIGEGLSVYGADAILPGLITIGASGWHFGRELYKEKKILRETYKNYDDIKVNLRKIVYTGEEPVVSNGVELKSGDELLYVHLPRFQENENDDPQLKAQKADKTWELYEYALDKIKDEIPDDSPFKAVCFDLDSADPVLAQALKFTDIVKREQLFDGKQLVFNQPNAEAVLVGTKELKRFNFIPRMLFRQAATVLGNPRLNSLLRDGANCETYEEQQAIKIAIQEVVKKIVFNQLVSYYNGPEVIKNRDLMANPNVKLRQNTVVEMGVRSGGLTYRKMVTDTGEVSEQMVERLLGLIPHLSEGSPRTKYQDARKSQSGRSGSLAEQFPEHSFQKKSPLQRAKAAYFMYWALQVTPFKMLIDRPYKADDLLSFIGNNPLEVTPEAGSMVQSLDKKKTEVKRLINIPKYLLPGVLSFGLFLAALQGERWAKDNIHLPEISGPNIGNVVSGGDTPAGVINNGQDLSNGVENSINARFTNGQIPSHSLDWKVTSSGNIDTGGYYILNTSYQMNPGSPTWSTDHPAIKVVEGMDVPKQPEGSDYIDLQKRVKVGDEHFTIVKLPIKDSTKLGAVKLSENGRSSINYRLMSLEDGTVEMIIEPYDKDSHVEDIDVYLVPGETQVHAFRKVAPINEKKLSPDAEALVEKAYTDTKASDSGYHQEITDLVRHDHKYSLVSPLEDQINSAKTPEETVNLSEQSQTCDCVICNAESVLLASAVDGTPVNLADGYFHDSSSQFLDGATSHAFGIDSKGKILDSTPGVPADPNEKVSPDALGNPEKEWQDKLDKMEKDSQLPFFLKAGAKSLAEALVVFGAAAFGLKKVIGSRRRARFNEKIKEAAEAWTKQQQFIRDTEESLLEELSEDDLNKARGFLNWVSYGGGKPYNPGIPRGEMSKAELLAAIKQEVDPVKMAEYINNPSAVDKMFSSGEQVKFRHLVQALPAIR